MKHHNKQLISFLIILACFITNGIITLIYKHTLGIVVGVIIGMLAVSSFFMYWYVRKDYIEHQKFFRGLERAEKEMKGD